MKSVLCQERLCREVYYISYVSILEGPLLEVIATPWDSTWSIGSPASESPGICATFLPLLNLLYILPPPFYSWIDHHHHHLPPSSISEISAWVHKTIKFGLW